MTLSTLQPRVIKNDSPNSSSWVLPIQDTIKSVMDQAKSAGRPFLKGKRNSFRREVVDTIVTGESKRLSREHGDQPYFKIKQILDTPDYKGHLRDMLRIAVED